MSIIDSNLRKQKALQLGAIAIYLYIKCQEADLTVDNRILIPRVNPFVAMFL